MKEDQVGSTRPGQMGGLRIGMRTEAWGTKMMYKTGRVRPDEMRWNAMVRSILTGTGAVER